MDELICREEKVKTSNVYLGYLILRMIKKNKENKITIYDVVDDFKRHNKIVHYRQVLFSLLFLYSCGLINFSAPYIYKV